MEKKIKVRRSPRRKLFRKKRASGGTRSGKTGTPRARRRFRPLRKFPKKHRKSLKPAVKKKTPKRKPPPKPAVTQEHNWKTWLVAWPVLFLWRATAGMGVGLRWPLRVMGLAALASLVLLAGVCAIYWVRAASFDLAQAQVMPERSVVIDKTGKEVGRLHGENRSVVPLAEISPRFVDALLAREDVRFFRHGGVDVRGALRSAYQNIKRRRLAQGASTLTMQLARNSFDLSDGKKWYHELDRKFLEMAVAKHLEARFSKEGILEMYINRIFWGHSIRGVEAAARTYLEKSARDLDLPEAALLAGIIRGPNAFSPFRRPEKAKRERNAVLKRMLLYGMISNEEEEEARKKPMQIRPKARRIFQYSYSMDIVNMELERILEEENIRMGGLTIKTTLDLDLQKAAESALDANLTEVEHLQGYAHARRSQWRAGHDPEYLQGALTIMENQSGAVLAVVGGRNAQESRFNRAINAKRQIGSLFKPFVFLAAMSKGLRPMTQISDARIRSGEIDGVPSGWSPQNSDGRYGGTLNVKDALVRSRNTSSVRVGDYAGLDDVREIARQAFAKKIPRVPASYLGAWNASTWETASAYTLFANGGVRRPPYLIEGISNASGTELYRHRPIETRICPVGAAAEVSKMLEEVASKGTASALRTKHGFTAPAAGKTGTTDKYYDAWFAGYTSSLSCAVWVGMDRPRTTINGGYGARLALPIWADVMKAAQRLGRYPMTQLIQPEGFTAVELCNMSGRLATPICTYHGTAYTDYIPSDLFPEKVEHCPLHPMRAEPVDQAAGQRGGRQRPSRALPVE